MAGTFFVIRDAAVRPRRGQQLVLTHHDRQIRTTVRTLSKNWLEVLPDSLSRLRHLRAGTRFTAHILTGEGIIEGTAALVGCHEDSGTVTLQLLSEPHLLQRRGHPRVAVQLRTALMWMAPGVGTPNRIEGTTQNLSMGGMLLRFPPTPVPLPGGEAATLLGLWLPEGPVSLAGHVLQAWDAGARIRFVDVLPEVLEQLRGFVEPRLSLPRLEPAGAGRS